MTNQEVFTAVYSHLLTQASRSVRTVKHFKRDEIEAAYRGNDDKRCPVGFLLDDTEYDPKMEGCSFGSYIANFAPAAMKEKWRENIELLDVLCLLHDFTDPAQWAKELASIASSFKLTIPPAKQE